MRLRNVQGAKEAIDRNEFVIKEPRCQKGHWNELFGTDAPIDIEVGMGKGRFLITLAQQNPEINYVGIEKFSSVLIRALEKQNELRLPNLYFLREDATELTEFFGKSEVDRIYLNFSDPWPKDRHAKRRLTSKEFFARYNQILKPEGEVQFKTDNRILFDFSLGQIEEAGWETSCITYDLHHSEYAEGNVMTEYEEKFSKKGNPICKLVARRNMKNV
ncbi:MAG: tRNA (guanosine(46)-N7)-methyltransferase TrmB [Lachnospiraceae bacterium]|nr:tRNA (guanosine(46)-N7)-methyltransferase TrmB [Lachnospiraceae bacterium]